MNESKPFTIKTVLLLLLACSLIYFQINTSQKLVNMEAQLNMLRNDINGIHGLVSQQNYMMTAEKADYIFYGLTTENEKLNAKAGVLSMKMNLSFTKLPADAAVFLEVQGTKDHFPPVNGEPGVSIEMTKDYDAAQAYVFEADGLNLYASDMTFDIGQNYKVTLVIKTATDTYSEMLGVIAALEWSEPAQYATVEVLNLSSVSKTANFSYKMGLVSLAESNNGFEFYDSKNLYDFRNLSANQTIDLDVISKVVKASYKITYLDKVIKEGELTPYVHPETLAEGWNVEDKVEFEVDASTDYASALQVEFKTTDDNGKVNTIKRGVFH